MIAIWFEAQAQTHHSAVGIASGHYDVALTAYGRVQAPSVLRSRYAGQHFDVVYTSDTQRAYDTACLMFAGHPVPILQDARLRECDYGDFEGRPRPAMEAARTSAIHAPFPHGESYAQLCGPARRRARWATPHARGACCHAVAARTLVTASVA